MKLLACKECGDLVRLLGDWRFCACGKSAGKYLQDGSRVGVHGPSVVVGADTGDFAAILGRNRSRKPLAVMFPISEDSGKIVRFREVAR